MRQYTEEFKEQILGECQEVGNGALVVRPLTILSEQGEPRKNLNPKKVIFLLPKT